MAAAAVASLYVIMVTSTGCRPDIRKVIQLKHWLVGGDERVERAVWWVWDSGPQGPQGEVVGEREWQRSLLLTVQQYSNIQIFIHTIKALVSWAR